MSDKDVADAPPNPQGAESARATQPKPNVHPLARKLAGLMSPMSLRDQQAASFWCTAIITGSLAVSFPVAYYLQNLFFTIFSVFAASLVATAVCVPNWRQRKDAKLKFADDRDVWDYYQELKKAREAAGTAGKAAEEAKAK